MIEFKQSLKTLEQKIGYILPDNASIVPLAYMHNYAIKLEKEIAIKEMEAKKSTPIKIILNKLSSNLELSRKERREIPFVMADVDCSISLFDKCMELMDLSNIRTVRRLIFAYFLNYTQMNDEKQKYFCNIIIERLSLDNHGYLRGELFQKLKNFKKVIFTSPSSMNVSRIIDRKGIRGTGKALSLPEQLIFSSLMLDSVYVYYTKINGCVKNKMRVLDEIVNDIDHFKAMIPKIADKLIRDVQNDNTVEKSNYKKTCIDVFYDVLGDPRFGDWTVRWNEVTDESRRIFLSWLAEKDLDLFFKIIEETAVDNMWSYRKEFWRQYLPYIKNTWVLFGRDAIRYVRRLDNKRLSYGKLGKDCLPDHSVFAFQIGSFVFIEWSHAGMLRVWDHDEAPKIFGASEMHKKDIANAYYRPLEEWRHAASAYQNWQGKVKNWLGINCNIWPD